MVAARATPPKESNANIVAVNTKSVLRLLLISASLPSG
jgi:hypothetical protein